MDCDKILQTDGGSIITGLRCFSLPLILDCGQAFRWSENADGSWSGVAMSRELRLKQDGDRLFFENTTPDEIKNIWIKTLLPKRISTKTTYLFPKRTVVSFWVYAEL